MLGKQDLRIAHFMNVSILSYWNSDMVSDLHAFKCHIHSVFVFSPLFTNMVSFNADCPFSLRL